MNLHGKESWKSCNYETISVTEPFVKCHVWDLFADHQHPATKLHICFQGPLKCPRWSTDLSKKSPVRVRTTLQLSLSFYHNVGIASWIFLDINICKYIVHVCT